MSDVILSDVILSEVDDSPAVGSRDKSQLVLNCSIWQSDRVQHSPVDAAAAAASAQHKG